MRVPFLFLVVGAVLALPAASALDVLPSEMHLGAKDARILVRAQEDALVRVVAEPALDVALVAPGLAPVHTQRTPATLSAPAGEWHGLEGVVELVLRRDSARRDVSIEIDDGGQAGFLVEWPRTSNAALPSPGLFATFGVFAALACLRTRIHPA